MDQPWLLAVLFALSLAALGLLTRAVLRMLRAARLFDVPLAGRQDVEFPAAGPVVLCLVFMRPHLARGVLLTVGITLASAVAVASLVFFLLAVTGVGTSASWT